jgi:hypothetical protein
MTHAVWRTLGSTRRKGIDLHPGFRNGDDHFGLQSQILAALFGALIVA